MNVHLNLTKHGLISTALISILAFIYSHHLNTQPPHHATMASPSKRGLCWPTANHGQDEVHTFTRPGSKISWLYNWSPDATPNANSLDYVPMQWNHIHIDDLASKAKTANATAVLGFNEPELPDQSNMSVELAAREWLRSVEPLRKAGVRCGSPGISSAPQGVVWLKEFIGRIRDRGSDVDFYCFHWYGVELGQFYDYLWSTYYQMPDQTKKVWVTEWACKSSVFRACCKLAATNW